MFSWSRIVEETSQFVNDCHLCIMSMSDNEYRAILAAESKLQDHGKFCTLITCTLEIFRH